VNERILGKEGLRVSELGLGCMGMSEFYGTGDEDESIVHSHHPPRYRAGCYLPRHRRHVRSVHQREARR
jgi:hypothetical protein